jgi:hypothetical protein
MADPAKEPITEHAIDYPEKRQETKEPEECTQRATF